MTGPMTGPEHYVAAQDLLNAVQKVTLQHDGSSPEATLLLAEAQVHATLALAAATALQNGANDWNAWRQAASVDRPAVTE